MSAVDPNAQARPGAGIFALETRREEARVVLVPVPFEATVSYGSGASLGPDAILAASHQVDLFDVETGHPYRAGIFQLPTPQHILAKNGEARAHASRVIESAPVSDDARDAARSAVNAAGMEVNTWVEETVRGLLEEEKIVGTIGGDHSIAFGAIRAHAQHFGEIGILHVDAHADLREAYQGFTWSHASIMGCVLDRVPEVKKIAQVAIRDFCPEELARIEHSEGRVQTWFDPSIARARARGALLEVFEDIVSVLPKKVYVSIDIDGLDPKLCPHTGTPVPGGLDFNELSMLLETVVNERKRIVGFDLVEVAPGPEGDEWDANVGARVLYKLIGWTLKSQA